MALGTRLLVGYGVLLAVGTVIYQHIYALETSTSTTLVLWVAAAIGGAVVSMFVGARLLR